MITTPLALTGPQFSRFRGRLTHCRYDGAIMMTRMQISLPPEDHRRVRARAAELGVSAAEYVRRLVARDLGPGPDRGNVEALFDLGHSGGSNVAQEKDRYVGEAVEAAN